MKVILSIKPEFVEKIFSGTKKYEFRRSLFKDKSVTTVVIYASAPISKIVGEFEIGDIVHDKIESVWDLTKKYSGIDESFFLQYFSGKSEAFAIKIRNAKKYRTPISIRDEYGIAPPQSFAYIR